MAADEIAIKVDHVSKTFKLPHEKQSSIKGALINFARHKKGYEKQHVLKDISFEIKKGEFFGIVGRNGSGKSTLLKLLAGIYTQDKGNIQINGKLTPFIELGVGFNPELTGRENVFLNGALLGFNRKEMQAMYSDIVEFAELEQFMDQKLKNYSSGMQVRLAFSIAIRAKSDILILDEVLAVGDGAFQQKCFDYFKELKKSGATVCLVTHDMDAVKRFCDRAMLVNRSSVELIGQPSRVAQEYDKLNFDRIEASAPRHNQPTKQKFYKYKIASANNQKMFKIKDTVSIDLDLEFTDKIPRLVVPGIAIARKDNGQMVAATNSYNDVGPLMVNHKCSLSYKFVAGQLTRGTYDIDFFVLDADNDYRAIIQEPVVFTIKVTEYDKARWGIFNIKGEWKQ